MLLFDSMWKSEKDPRDFTDIVFQIQVKEMLSVALGNEPETEPGSVTYIGGQAESSPHAAVF